MHLVYLQTKNPNKTVEFRLNCEACFCACCLDNLNLESFCIVFSYLWQSNKGVVSIAHYCGRELRNGERTYQMQAS